MPRRPVQSRQRKVNVLNFTIDMTSSNVIAGLDKDLVTLNVDTGTGDVTVDFNLVLNNAVAQISTATADSIPQVGTLGTTSIQILGFDATDGTTAKDIKAHVTIFASEISDTYNT